MNSELKFRQVVTRLQDVESVVGGTGSESPRRGTVSTGDILDSPWLFCSKIAFGFTLVSPIVTVIAGKVRPGIRVPIAVGSSGITIPADHTWIFVTHVYGSGAASLQNSTTEPVDTVDTHYHVLHQWRLIDGVVSLEGIRHLGDIWLPGNFA